MCVCVYVYYVHVIFSDMYQEPISPSHFVFINNNFIQLFPILYDGGTTFWFLWVSWRIAVCSSK
jgi:hypothetical protein